MLRVRVEADIEIGGAEPFSFGSWVGYAVEHDLRQVFPTVRLTAGGDFDKIDFLLGALDYHPTMRVRVDGTLVATCRVVSDVASIARRGGGAVSLVGAGLTQRADKDAMPLGWRSGTLTVIEAARDIMRPHGIEVVAEATAAQAQVATRRTRTRTIDSVTGQTRQTTLGYVPDGGTTQRVTTTTLDDRSVRPKVGETRLGFLRRMLREHKLLCWETPDGKLFVGLPQPASAVPSLTLDMVERDAGEGRIEEATRSRRYGNQHTGVRVVGRGRGATRTVDATATAAALVARGWSDALVIVEAPDLRGQVEAQRRADLAMAAEKLAGYDVQIKISGHGLGTALAAMDRNVAVNAPRIGLRHEQLYCIARTFEHSRRGGTTTRLTCVKRGLWQAGT